ncbi:MAG: 50S ribosomal protein L23 [Candidatus Methanofastidiosa archaeon]|jgi:large subunit ribosomal protein L23|nr:50S ribosomal protein L23 [Candidatus Methanofastidiosa archaeon]MDD4280612.1 50S ribosomal protein L23 [Candidatus Methanofastidiosa archaeon]
MNPYDVVLYPLISEKTVSMMERENKLVFIVTRKASKNEIKGAVEKLYKVEVSDVSVLIQPDGKKRAFVKLREEYLADEVATKMGVF